MKPAVLAAAVLLIVGAACGKVGDPRPPINREPLVANGLSASQSGDVVTLSWTNPARYVDNNAITDLAYVRVFRNGTELARVKAQPAGHPQSFTIDVSRARDSDLTLAVQAETSRGRLSPVSEAIRIRPKEVPGSPRFRDVTVDLDRIRLEWLPPETKPELAEVYLVQRAGRPGVVSVTTTQYEDEDFEPEKKYEYTITAARAGSPVVPGLGITISVTAKDENPPAIPAGLQVVHTGALLFLNWDANSERDFKEYRVFRSDKPDDPLFPPDSINGKTDRTYRTGLTYQIQAVDKSGNTSAKSPPKGVE